MSHNSAVCVDVRCKVLLEMLMVMCVYVKLGNKVTFVMFLFLWSAGSVLGAGDERPENRCEAEEGAGATVQPSAY